MFSVWLCLARLGPRLRRDGHRLQVWVVNTADDLDLCLALGVEAVMTDRPDYILGLLRNR